ncbi:CBL-interacting serine/threonine-protein kinase 23 [Glycine soja]|uniref:CBL-interacting serine/threonine-protein kinase 23 n=1 Tax=Glycine soja TaxID=3848 RepID=A0A0B2R4Y4_GLYSO|nr:CBL-interacting serine/threonine-protein kinase 23 [Glycine soja]
MATTARVYIVMELVIGGGPLLDKINFSRLPGRTSGMSETKARHYFHQLICAVDCCHRRGVIHRDLKQSNLLLDADGVLRVSDFGMSALPQQARQDGLLHSACGALDYIAPEVIRNRGYEGKKADIWSCGAILFHLVAGYVPFRNEYDDRNTKIRQILQADFICPSFFSSSLITLIRRILDPNPTTRITMNEIFENEWFMQNYQPPRFFRQNFSFGHVQLKRETRFISQNPVDEIIDGIERVAGIMGFDVKKINNFRMSIEGGANARRKGHLSIFTKFCRHIYAALSDFIWKGRAEPMDTETDG